jgi:prepilin-type N-terminal cleavage/methylation domain-containing protein
MRHEKGFTLVELVVVMAISMFVLVAASKVMISMTSQFKQQTRISEKSIESGVGLELFRKDISATGFGVPSGLYSGPNKNGQTDWSLINTTYTELVDSQLPGSTFDAENAPPKMIDAMAPGTQEYGLNGSSYLVIRSAAVGLDPIAGKFFLIKNYKSDVVPSSWVLEYAGGESDPWRNPFINGTDRVIVTSTADPDNLGLVTNPRKPSDPAPFSFHTQSDGIVASFASPVEGEVFIVYGISSKSNKLVAPFNRVDYYVSNMEVPSKCATGTGVLYRRDMRHSDGMLDTPVRVFDCVALMQVVFGFDDDKNGEPEVFDDVTTGRTATGIRKNLKRVDVYILTHEGQFEPGYEYNDTTGTGQIVVGGDDGPVTTFDAPGVVGSNLVNAVPYWKHFRWRVYKISERPVGKGTY